MQADVHLFGALRDGAPVQRVWITNSRGMRAGILTLGATLQTLTAPNELGVLDDIVLGHDDLAPYVETPSYMGAIVGRFANRIAGAAFDMDGRSHYLTPNDGVNTLHGGVHGFDKAIWRIVSVERNSVTLAHTSADSDQGFPGALETQVSYCLSEEAPELTISIEARSSTPTFVSLTSHAFFNLAGARSDRDILDHELVIAADNFTPVDSTLIPTGELRSVSSSAFDFRQSQKISAHIGDQRDDQLIFGRGYDHNFVLRGGATTKPKAAARLAHPGSRREMTLLTTAPGLQLYSGNFLDGRLIGKGGVAYRRNYGLCLEPQHFPNAPNQPAFPSARLDPGQTYLQTSIYRFSPPHGGKLPD